MQIEWQPQAEKWRIWHLIQYLNLKLFTSIFQMYTIYMVMHRASSLKWHLKKKLIKIRINSNPKARPSIQFSTNFSTQISLPLRGLTFFSKLYSLLPSTSYAGNEDLNSGLLSTVPQWLNRWKGKKCECTVGSHRFFQARVGQNVSCLYQQWSAPKGCDCWVSSHSDGGVSSALLPGPCCVNPPSTGQMPPCCQWACLQCTKTVI